MFVCGMSLLGGNCGLVASIGTATSVGGLLSREERFSSEVVSTLAAAIDRLGGGSVGGIFDLDDKIASRGFGSVLIGELRAAGFFGTGGAGLWPKEFED